MCNAPSDVRRRNHDDELWLIRAHRRRKHPAPSPTSRTSAASTATGLYDFAMGVPAKSFLSPPFGAFSALSKACTSSSARSTRSLLLSPFSLAVAFRVASGRVLRRPSRGFAALALAFFASFSAALAAFFAAFSGSIVSAAPSAPSRSRRPSRGVVRRARASPSSRRPASSSSRDERVAAPRRRATSRAARRAVHASVAGDDRRRVARCRRAPPRVADAPTRASDRSGDAAGASRFSVYAQTVRRGDFARVLETPVPYERRTEANRPTARAFPCAQTVTRPRSRNAASARERRLEANRPTRAARDARRIAGAADDDAALDVVVDADARDASATPRLRARVGLSSRRARRELRATTRAIEGRRRAGRGDAGETRAKAGDVARAAGDAAKAEFEAATRGGGGRGGRDDGGDVDDARGDGGG